MECFHISFQYIVFVGVLVVRPTPPDHLTCGRTPIEPSISWTRIIGGVEALRNSWPWQCYLGGCGASVLTPDYILTAAHCLYVKPLSSVISKHNTDCKPNYMGGTPTLDNNYVHREP